MKNGEFGYVVAVAFGVIIDKSESIVPVIVREEGCNTGPTAASVLVLLLNARHVYKRNIPRSSTHYCAN